MKHAKGPWKIKHNVPGSPTTRKYHEVLITSDTWIVAWLNTCHHLNKEELALANAHLIAAAPELLEACKSALALIEISTDFAGMSTAKELQAAITKATGREV